MQEDKSRLINYAMYGGLFLGLFWIAKYFFVQMSGFEFLNPFLALGTPLILFYFLVKYKNDVVGGEIGYWHGVQFGVVLFFLASIPEAVVVIVNITWFDTAFIGMFYNQLIETLKQLNVSDLLVKSLEEQPLPSAANFVFGNVIMADVFRGVLLSLLVVPLAMRFKPNTSNADRN